MNRIYIHITQQIPVCLILIGFLALSAHPITHGFTHFDDVASQQSELPINHDGEDCLECVLSQVLSSEIELPDKVGVIILTGQIICEGSTERYAALINLISPRGPPQDYV